VTSWLKNTEAGMGLTLGGKTINSIMDLSDFADIKQRLKYVERSPTDDRFYDEIWLHTFQDYVWFTGWLSKKLPWSFRGMRSDKFTIGINYKCSKNGKDIISSKLGEFERIFSQFRNRCLAFIWPNVPGPEDEWRWMFYAQHEGLRTRLLDWTTSPIVALYFAVETINAKRKDSTAIQDDKDADDFGTVWCLSVDPIHYQKPEEIGGPPASVTTWKMIDPPHINSRLVRQAGKFTFHPRVEDRLDFDKAALKEKGIMVKIVLKDANGINPAEDLRWHLAINNINYATLFHDVESIAKHLNEEWLSIGKRRSL
jgi:hypothetical protein